MGSAELLDMSYRLLADNPFSTYAIGLRNGTRGGNPTDDVNACTSSAATIGPLVSAFADLLASGTNNIDAMRDPFSVGLAFHGVRAREVRVAPNSLSIRQPDCDGQTAVFGTPTPDEAACPIRASPTAFQIPAWNPGQ